jgi:single-strand DNA-binding protein
MADLNRVFLMGRLTFDPELRRTSTGTAVTVLPLATTRSWQGRDNERREDTLFIDVQVWDRQAENCCQYLKKGSLVHVEGSLRRDSWEDKNTGEKRFKILVNADRVQFLDPRRADGTGPGPDEDYGAAPPPGRDTSARRPSAQNRSDSTGASNGPAGADRPVSESADRRVSNGGAPGEEEDIPF